MWRIKNAVPFIAIAYVLCQILSIITIICKKNINANMMLVLGFFIGFFNSMIIDHIFNGYCKITKFNYKDKAGSLYTYSMGISGFNTLIFLYNTEISQNNSEKPLTIIEDLDHYTLYSLCWKKEFQEKIQSNATKMAILLFSSVSMIIQLYLVFRILHYKTQIELYHDVYLTENMDYADVRIVCILIVLFISLPEFYKASHQVVNIFNIMILPSDIKSKVKIIVKDLLLFLGPGFQLFTVLATIQLTNRVILEIPNEENMESIIQNFGAMCVLTQIDNIAGDFIIWLVTFLQGINLKVQAEESLEEIDQKLKTMPKRLQGNKYTVYIFLWGTSCLAPCIVDFLTIFISFY